MQRKFPALLRAMRNADWHRSLRNLKRLTISKEKDYLWPGRIYEIMNKACVENYDGTLMVEEEGEGLHVEQVAIDDKDLKLTVDYMKFLWKLCPHVKHLNHIADHYVTYLWNKLDGMARMLETWTGSCAGLFHKKWRS